MIIVFLASTRKSDHKKSAQLDRPVAKEVATQTRVVHEAGSQADANLGEALG